MDLESSLPAVKKFVNMLYAQSFDQVKRKHSSACVSGGGEKMGWREVTSKEICDEGVNGCFVLCAYT